MSGFYMRVLASDHVFYQGRVEAVTLPGDDGERTVLAHHADSIISIRDRNTAMQINIPHKRPEKIFSTSLT